MIESITLSEYLHDIELAVVGGGAEKVQDRLTMTGYCRYGNHVFHITYILSFGSEGHTLLRMEKSTHYLLVTYAVKREKPISIIEQNLSFLCKDREEKFINKPYNVNNKDKLLSAKRKMRGQEVSHGMG